MERAGVCGICGRSSTHMVSCVVCGLAVCSSCYNHNLGACTNCEGRFRNR